MPSNIDERKCKIECAAQHKTMYWPMAGKVYIYNICTAHQLKKLINQSAQNSTNYNLLFLFIYNYD